MSAGMRTLGVAVLLAALMSTATAVRAQTVSEYEVKAAFLYNFARFVTWPAESFSGPQAPFVIGVLGNDPFGGRLEEMVRGKTNDGRDLVVRKFKREQWTACQILFISASERRRLPEILQDISQASVLTVADFDDFAQKGGIINFREQDGKIRMEINVNAADRAGLKLSSKLLQLATLVKETNSR